MLGARAPADQVRLERMVGDALPGSGPSAVSGSMLLRRSPVLPLRCRGDQITMRSFFVERDRVRRQSFTHRSPPARPGSSSLRLKVAAAPPGPP